MAYTTRVLPPEEWPKLAGTLLESSVPHLDRQTCTVIVVEADGKIVGSVLLNRCWHLEGVSIDDAYRGHVSVGRALVRGIRAELTDRSVDEFFTMGLHGEPLGARLGQATKLDGHHYAVKVGGL